MVLAADWLKIADSKRKMTEYALHYTFELVKTQWNPLLWNFFLEELIETPTVNLQT